MIKCSEEGVQKAETVQKVGLLHQTDSQVVYANKKYLKDTKYATPVNIVNIYLKNQEKSQINDLTSYLREL